MGKNEMKLAIQHERKRQRLGKTRCENCGVEDIRVLQASKIEQKQLILCAECRLLLQDNSAYEDHHVLGRAQDDFTVSLPANDHAILSEVAMVQNPISKEERLRQWLNALKAILTRFLELINDEINRLNEESLRHWLYALKDILARVLKLINDGIDLLEEK